MKKSPENSPVKPKKKTQAKQKIKKTSKDQKQTCKDQKQTCKDLKQPVKIKLNSQNSSTTGHSTPRVPTNIHPLSPNYVLSESDTITHLSPKDLSTKDAMPHFTSTEVSPAKTKSAADTHLGESSQDVTGTQNPREAQILSASMERKPDNNAEISNLENSPYSQEIPCAQKPRDSPLPNQPNT